MIHFTKFNRFLRAASLAAALGLLGCRPSSEPSGPPARVVEAMNRGVSRMGQYQYDEAAKAFEEVLRADPSLNDAKVNLAIALFNRNRKEDQDLVRAGKLLDEVLLKDPENLRALYFKGIALQHVGQAEGAVPCFEKVVAKRPDDGAAWFLLALCKQRLGQSNEVELLRAVQHRPYLYSAYYQLYQTAMRAGQDVKAKEYLEQFKKLRESPLGESIELPQYNQMGELALVTPIAAPGNPPVTKSRNQLKPANELFAWQSEARADSTREAPLLGGMAVGDINRDGLPDLIVPLDPPGRVVILRQSGPGHFVDATAGSGLEALTNAVSCALGDFDNDDVPDLFVVCANGSRLFKGKGDGTFTDVTQAAGFSAASAGNRSALFLDADHDGDLDLFVCNSSANQLWNNNGDGTFTNIADKAGVAIADGHSVLVLPGDLDNDRDMDLVVLRAGQAAKIFLNELLGQYREADLHGLDIRGDAGGVLQDFNGDGAPDLLVLGGNPRELKLFLGDGHGGFKPSATFAETTKAVASWGPLRGFRVADIDLDGDLDVMCFGTEAHLLLNDGRGRFVLQNQVWKPTAGQTLAGAELLDVTGDFVPDLLVVERGATNRVLLSAGELLPSSTALAVQPSGIRGRDGRTRSPASGYGVRITARAGLREQRIFHMGLSGGANQSFLPAMIGLGGASQADYVNLLWPDGVAQVEMAVPAGQILKVAELQRKISSCPVLFAWNGTRFEFVTDFAGVGGLGYYSAPGVSAPPQVLEHVKIEPDQLRVKDGFYELRVAEPMEETAYVDRLELLAIDHPTNQPVFPDERLAINGPPPTHKLLAVDKPIFAVKALVVPDRSLSSTSSATPIVDCADRLARVDRIYAYEPPLDRRYIGFCRPHSLELDFGDRLAGFTAQDKVVLFIHGFIEYPYSQTVYAAAQSRIGWEPIRVERQDNEDHWETIVPDAGAPGGMARMMTVDLTGKLAATTRKLRLTTNLEIFYDQIFVARHAGLAQVVVQSVPLADAVLRKVGFPREVTPDGRMPLIYDYNSTEPTAPFHVLKGAYTRYGPVKELLANFDDNYVLIGPGDEIALKFDASKLPALAPGRTRSFILVSHAYCKDMDLYTATPQTLEPWPFRVMSRYPYPPTERYPATKENQAFLRTYNTRIVE